MARIFVLDKATADKIAAGEVIERPASIVKELAENAIDAGAKSIVVKIQEGGTSLIRVFDNGCGIPKEDVPKAFLSHSTSKIRSIDDLTAISSLGFRGEALSSIAAVSKTELITKTKDEISGTRYVIEGGEEILTEDFGAPEGTTFTVRQLFYNVPARRKFLKSAPTEAGHIQDLLTRLALSHPDISFVLESSAQEKLRTSGNGNLKDAIYSIYGRDAATRLLGVDYEKNGIRVTGFSGKSELTRANRNFENFFVNGRWVKSPMLSKAVEDAYSGFLMQRRFPFVVLNIALDGDKIDVNVHPAKLEIRFQNQQQAYDAVFEAVRRTLLEPEMIPLSDAPGVLREDGKKKSPFLLEPTREGGAPKAQDEEYFIEKMRERVAAAYDKGVLPALKTPQSKGETPLFIKEEESADMVRESGAYTVEKPRQISAFDENFLKRDAKADYRIIGQAFGTYWIVEFNDKLYMIDQHAAHERVLYERTMRQMKTREFTSQGLSPPLILSLSVGEAQALKTHMALFTDMGFEIEPFGGEEYAVRAVPANLFGIAKKELLTEMIDSLADGISTSMPAELIKEKVASMSCKAAVKGNSALSFEEADALIGELLGLENPYHCPHGRPVIIAMTKRELDKKFKRIV